MSRTVSGAVMVRHVLRLTEAVELLRKHNVDRSPYHLAEAQGLISFTRDMLLHDCVDDVVVEGAGQ